MTRHVHLSDADLRAMGFVELDSGQWVRKPIKSVNPGQTQLNATQRPKHQPVPQERRIDSTDGYDSQLERDYAECLELLRIGGEIVSWEREPEALRLYRRPNGRWMTYWPDFVVIALDGVTEYHEVKPTRIGKKDRIGIMKLELAVEICRRRSRKLFKITRVSGEWKTENLTLAKG